MVVHLLQYHFVNPGLTIKRCWCGVGRAELPVVCFVKVPKFLQIQKFTLQLQLRS